MTMHLVRGMTTISTRKRKARQKTAAVLEEERKTAKLLKSLRYDRNAATQYRSSIPDYKVNTNIQTSDVIVPMAGKRKENCYTGDELSGIGTLHQCKKGQVW